VDCELSGVVPCVEYGAPSGVTPVIPPLPSAGAGVDCELSDVVPCAEYGAPSVVTPVVPPLPSTGAGTGVDCEVSGVVPWAEYGAPSDVTPVIPASPFCEAGCMLCTGAGVGWSDAGAPPFVSAPWSVGASPSEELATSGTLQNEAAQFKCFGNNWTFIDISPHQRSGTTSVPAP
jgi:hypothetical protein